MSTAALDLYWSRFRSFAKSNWKYAVAFGLGSLASAICSFLFAKSVTGLSAKWMIFFSMIGKYKQKYRNVLKYEGFSVYPSAMRPSNENIAWDAFFREMTMKSTLNYKTSAEEFKKEYLKYRQMNVSQRTKRANLPDFVPTPDEVTITQTSVKNNGPLKGSILRYPGAEVENGVILWIHGGGHYMGYPEEGYGMLPVMAQYLGILALSVDYHYCPEISLPQQVDECIEGYKYILNTMKVEANKVFVCGVSAGGTLALLVLQKLNQLKLPQPAGGIILSGACDLSMRTALKCEQEEGIQDAMFRVVPNYRVLCVDDADRQAYDKADEKGQDAIMLAGKYSPLNGEWKGMCPLYISASMNEALVNDSKLMVAKCKEFGVEYDSDFDPYLLHATVAFAAVIPEARDKLILIIEWMKQKLKPKQQLKPIGRGLFG